MYSVFNITNFKSLYIYKEYGIPKCVICEKVRVWYNKNYFHNTAIIFTSRKKYFELKVKLISIFKMLLRSSKENLHWTTTNNKIIVTGLYKVVSSYVRHTTSYQSVVFLSELDWVLSVVTKSLLVTFLKPLLITWVRLR